MYENLLAGVSTELWIDGTWRPASDGARFEVEDYASDCCRNWKSGGIDPPFATAFENPVRRTRKHSKFVRFWWRDSRSLQVFCHRFRGNGAARKINFLLWKTIKRRFRQAEIFRQQGLRRMPDPIGDTKRAELREITVIKD